VLDLSGGSVDGYHADLGTARLAPLAVEPWTRPPCLARAAARETEARLEPGAALDVLVEVTVFQPAGCPLRGVVPGGKIDVQNPKEG